MLTSSHTRLPSLIVGLLTLMVSACAPQGQVASPGPSAPERPAARKTLTIADSYEATGIIETFITQTRLWLSSRAPRLDIDVIERLTSLMPLPCPPPPPDDLAAIEAVVNVIRTNPDA